jgi:hypothetical protein
MLENVWLLSFSLSHSRFSSASLSPMDRAARFSQQNPRIGFQSISVRSVDLSSVP